MSSYSDVGVVFHPQEGGLGRVCDADPGQPACLPPVSTVDSASTPRIWLDAGTSKFRSAWRTVSMCLAALALSILARPAFGGLTAVEYFHGQFGHYFLTANADEIVALDRGAFAGWARTGKTIPVFESTADGARPVCRFFSASFAPKSSHFYTPVIEECEWVKQNPVWIYEGIAFHLRMPDTSGQCPLGSQRLYRFYNDGKTGAPNHRYMTWGAMNLAEMQASGWIMEGTTADGVFACARADDASIVLAGGLKGTAELAPHVRILAPTEVAEILTMSDTTMTLAGPIGLAVGDVFIVDDVGGFRVHAVADIGRMVAIEEVAVDELYTALELEGEVSLAALSKGRVLEDAWSKALLDPEISFYSHSASSGEQGVKADFKVKAECNLPDVGATFEFVDVSLGIYGPPRIKASKTLREYKIGNTKVVLDAALRLGCKLAVSKTWLKRLLVIPTQVPGVSLGVRVGGELAGSGDLLPVAQLASVSIEGTIGDAEQFRVNGKVPDKSAILAAIGSQTGITISAEASAKLVAELTLDAPITIVGVGAKAGPVVSMRATVASAPSICLKVDGIVESYLKFRAPIELQSYKLSDTRTEIFKGFDLAGCGESVSRLAGLWQLELKNGGARPSNCGELRFRGNAIVAATAEQSTLSFRAVDGPFLLSSNLGIVDMIMTYPPPPEMSSDSDSVYGGWTRLGKDAMLRQWVWLNEFRDELHFSGSIIKDDQSCFVWGGWAGKRIQ